MSIGKLDRPPELNPDLLTGMSIAQTLPQDLLGEIFLNCLPHPFEILPLQPDLATPPLLLCYVCSSWRQTALATPPLWSELALQLEYVSVRSHLGGGFLRQKLRMLELWRSRMGALQPSLHFQRSHLRVHVSNDIAEVERRFTTFKEFFTNPSIAASYMLCFYAFSAPDLIWLSKLLTQLTFPNLTHLVISQPSGREHNTSTVGSNIFFSSSSAPNLKRLYLDSHTELASRPSTIIEAFSWTTLTHLAANFKLRRLDWYTVLQRCVSLTHCTVKLEFFHSLMIPDLNNRKPMCQNQLKEASVQTTSTDLPLVFDKFDLPSITKLRLSVADAAVSFPNLHQLLASTPSVRELHLQGCLPFGMSSFANSMSEANINISATNAPPAPLSTVLPDLQIMVVDSIGFRVTGTALPGDLIKLLRSAWLCSGWASSGSLEDQPSSSSSSDMEKRRIEFIIDKGHHFTLSIIRDLMRAIEADGGKLSASCPFEVKARYLHRGLWEWKQMSGGDLRDGWASWEKWTS